MLGNELSCSEKDVQDKTKKDSKRGKNRRNKENQASSDEKDCQTQNRGDSINGKRRQAMQDSKPSKYDALYKTAKEASKQPSAALAAREQFPNPWQQPVAAALQQLPNPWQPLVATDPKPVATAPEPVAAARDARKRKNAIRKTSRSSSRKYD